MANKFKEGDRVRSTASGTTGLVTERIVIEQGHEILPPRPGSTKDQDDGAVYDERVDLRVQYTDRNGDQAEVLMHETEAESA